jgi:metal-responsive CopG/Arc/MetJ family transcriptional regulator
MTKARPVGISLPNELLEKIDKERGKVPRSVWVVELIKKGIGDLK